MAFEHVFWAYRETPHGCRLQGLQNVEKGFQISDGVPRQANFSGDAHFTMNPDFPDDTIMLDNLKNTSVHIVASERLKRFLEGQQLPNMEYLPVTIFNHKSRPVSPPYFIIHPIHPVDCIDFDASEATWDELDDEAIERIGNFVVDDSKCDALPPLFRPNGLSRHLLVHRELAAALDAQGFTGNGWVEPSALVGESLFSNLDPFVQD